MEWLHDLTDNELTVLQSSMVEQTIERSLRERTPTKTTKIRCPLKKKCTTDEDARGDYMVEKRIKGPNRWFDCCMGRLQKGDLVLRCEKCDYDVQESCVRALVCGAKRQNFANSLPETKRRRVGEGLPKKKVTDEKFEEQAKKLEQEKKKLEEMTKKLAEQRKRHELDKKLLESNVPLLEDNLSVELPPANTTSPVDETMNDPAYDPFHGRKRPAPALSETKITTSQIRVYFTGWGKDESTRKKQLLKQFIALGNVTEHKDMSSVTHIVSGHLFKNVNTILGLLNNAKLMCPEWVEACITEGAVVDESPYLWTAMPKTHITEHQQQEMLDAIKLHETGRRPWQNQSVCLLMPKKHIYAEAYRDILEAAGAKIHKSFAKKHKLTYTIASDEIVQARHKSYVASVNAKVICLNDKFVLDSLFVEDVDERAYMC